MNYSEQQLAILSAQERNILPITSVCNVKCLFCSHQGNPKNVQTFSSGHRSLEELKEIIQFLNKDKKIVIGESITRICEGEPFTHPQIKTILELLRERFPSTVIQITTNGTKLDEETLNLLVNLEPIEINLSLNSANLIGRKKLMKDKKGEVVLKGVKELDRLNLPYHGSIVAMPQIIGWNDLKETISYLDRYGAQTIRVFLPGYTKLSPKIMKFDLKLWQQLKGFIIKCQQQYQVPITLEPATINNLEAEVVGVIQNSPAAKAGLKVGDKIIAINSEEVISRVDAFDKLLKASNPQVKVDQSGEIKELVINKVVDQRSGLVFNYDISPDLLVDIERIVTSYGAEKILILTSQLAEKRINLGLKILRDRNAKLNFESMITKNQFFGGSILCAGLLVVNDFRRVLEEYKSRIAEVDLVLIPKVAFDNWGYDLVGESYHKLAEEFDIAVEIV